MTRDEALDEFPDGVWFVELAALTDHNLVASTIAQVLSVAEAAGKPILEARGVPAEVIYAIQSHATYLNIPRVHPLDKALFACDELVGLITAVTYVRPSRHIADVDVAAVRKKMRDKAFARNVSRQDILDGAAELGVDLDEHIAFVLAAMQERAHELGLDG